MEINPVKIIAHDIDYKIIGDDMQAREIQLDPSDAV